MLLKGLDILESFIYKELKPCVNSNPSDEDLEKYNLFIFIESSSVKQKIIEAIFLIKDPELITIFIHDQQSKLTQCADQLYTYFSAEDPYLLKIYSQPCLELTQRTTYNAIIGLLEFLHDRFSKFINLDEKVPEGIRAKVVLEYGDKIRSFEKLDTFSYKILLPLITEPVKKLLNENKPISISKLHYIKELADVFLESLIYEGENDYLIHLTKRLTYINFNTINFFNFITDEIRKNIDSYESLVQKIEQLSWFLKEANQTVVNPLFCFNKNKPSLKQLLSEWLEEELNYYEKLSKLPLTKVTDNISDESFKINTDLTVAQIGLFLRLLSETSIIKNINDRELTQFYALHTTTKRVENISPENLRKHFYKIEEQTKDDIKVKLLEMLKNLQNMK